MATNKNQVTKVEFAFHASSFILENRRLSQRLVDGRYIWDIEIFTELLGSETHLMSLTGSLTSMTRSFYRNDYAKIEIINSSGISIFSLIVKWCLNINETIRRFCNLTYLSENNSDLTGSDGNLKLILSLGPLKCLMPASPGVVALKSVCVPRDKTPMESLKSMLDKGILTDVVIKTSTKSFPCHKVVLAASSEIFKAMFEVEMKESVDNEVKLEGVFEAATIQDLLHYLYTKQTPPNIGQTCSTLFVAAEYFQLPVLKAVCEEKLRTVITVENAADVLQLAEKYDAGALKKTAVKFIVDHYKDVMNTPGWKEIPDDMAKCLLSTFLVTFAEKMKEDETSWETKMIPPRVPRDLT